jgi:outer membrane protein OmpA-like peptidoglycan-associated protein
MKKNVFLLYLFLILIPVALTGQNTKSKADKIYEKAVECYSKGDKEQAIKYLNDIIKSDAGFVKAYLVLGDIYKESARLDDAIAAYQKAIQADSVFFPSATYILASMLFEQQRYSEAKTNYNSYLSSKSISQAETEKCLKNIALCDFRNLLIGHPVAFNPVNLGPAINTPGYEFINSVSIDESLLLFTHRDIERGSPERFFWSKKINGQWSPAEEMPPPLNSDGNQGALTLSPDGMTVLFAACSLPDSYGGCDLYISRRNGTNWSIPVNLGPVVNSTSWDSQPSMSSDGKTVYFASSRSGGKGGSDIYFTVKQDNGTWSIPENLGDSINTSDAETTPFIHPDGNTLYFSSKGHPGMGGADLFVSTRKPDGHWSKPGNIGYPLNTKGEEINIIVSSGGETGYISAEREGGFGKTDIYRFEIPEASRPKQVSYVNGKVYDSKTMKPLAASFELIDLRSSKIIVSSSSDAVSGEFLLCVPAGNDYALNVSCDKYLFYSQNFSLANLEDRLKPKYLDIPLQPIDLGKTMVLRNIFFETDRFDLKPESFTELKKLTNFMVQNPKLKIEISGHTDDVGSEAHNLELSGNRALSVYNYLINNGIDKNRLSYKGYGKSKPIDTNLTPEGRANNRRTEFSVSAR